jgi:hypothetical protein
MSLLVHWIPAKSMREARSLPLGYDGFYFFDLKKTVAILPTNFAEEP